MSNHQLNAFRSNAAAEGVTMSLTRGTTTVELPYKCLIGLKEYQVGNAAGLLVSYSSHDILIAAEDYSLDGGTTLTKPQRGDILAHTRNGTVSAYKVQFPSTTAPPWKRSDHLGDVLRVHTVLDSETPAE